MNNSYRPHHPKTDANQKDIFRDLSRMVGGWQPVEDEKGVFLNAYTFTIMGIPGVIIDRSKAGGLNLDTTVYLRDRMIDVEIKQPGKREDLTAGEKLYFQLTPQTGRVVVNAEEYYDVLYEMAMDNEP